MVITTDSGKSFDLRAYRKENCELLKLDIFPETFIPRFFAQHKDGPVLICSDGTLHWLDLQEKMMLRIGALNIVVMNNRYSMLDQKAG